MSGGAGGPAAPRHPRPLPRFRLRGELDGEVLSCPLREGRNTLGSSRELDVVLRFHGVSRRHAVITVTGDRARLEDLGSRNGTFVNRQKVGDAVLRAGDVVRVGDVALVLELLDAADLELAIGAPPGAASARRAAPSEDTGTADTTDQGSRGWLELTRRLARRLRTEAQGRAGAIEELATSVGARGALLATGRAGSEMTVLASYGELPGPAALADLVTHRRGPEDRLEGKSDAPLQLVWCGEPSEAGAVTLLVLTGDFPERSRAGPLLRLALEIFLAEAGSSWPIGGSAGAAPPDPARAPGGRRAEPPDLRLPEGFVLGRSAAFQELCRQLRHFLRGSIPVLILGETGVGKELIARTLHASSERCQGPFVAINCAAIPGELLEAELFGVVKGTATGVAEREGIFESAGSGVVLLDEVGELPLALQAKLLRALQQKEVQPLGARAPRPVDVRLLSATSSDLAEKMARGAFRRDLYHRLAGVTVRVPPLRERRDDIPQLVERFFHRAVTEVGRDVRGISVRALEALVGAPWPGNVRELEHEVRRLVYLCPEGRAIDSSMLPPELLAPAGAGAGASAPLELDLSQQTAELEKRLITAALARTRWNKSETARLLGISRNGLLAKLRKLGIS